MCNTSDSYPKYSSNSGRYLTLTYLENHSKFLPSWDDRKQKGILNDVLKLTDLLQNNDRFAYVIPPPPPATP